MADAKTKILQIRLTDLEKKIIKEKAAILNMSVSEYVLKCCIFSNTTNMFIEKFFKDIL